VKIKGTTKNLHVVDKGS